MIYKKRLIQIAKELNVSINTLIDFLTLKGIHLGENKNQIINSEIYTLLKEEFFDSYTTKTSINLKKNKNLFIYTFNPAFYFLDDELETHSKIVSEYQKLITQINEIKKKEPPFNVLNNIDLGFLLEKKIEQLKKIQYNIIIDRKNNTFKSVENEKDIVSDENEIEDEYNFGSDSVDHEANIMNSFKNGTQDNYGY